MSARELAWRLAAKLRESADRCVLARRQRFLPLTQIAAERCAQIRPEVIARPWFADEGLSCALPRTERWRAVTAARAERIRGQHLDLFDLENVDLGARIAWNYEYKARKHAPLTFSADIDYRDYAVTGDAKFVWELNRHQHWVVLARAFHWTGDRRYAEAVAEQLDDWIQQCPFGVGMNWRSPLELAIRLINWTWACELIRPAGVLTGARWVRLLNAVQRHVWEIARKYSRYSSANNHRIGEAAGVFIATSYFAGLKRAAEWRAVSRRILLEEILNQVHADGVHRELATGYHLFVTQFFLLAALTARNAGEDFPGEYWGRLEGMFSFLAALAEGGTALPMFGDADDGYVLDLGGQPGDVAEWLAAGAAIFGRPDFKAVAPRFSETAFWLLGHKEHARFAAIDTAAAPDELASRAFPDAGYYLLQHGASAADNIDDRISMTFDCGELGFGPLAAHGHADALSFTLRIGGVDVFVDPGTYDYFTYGAWRDYFRSTRAHNTVTVDDADQSEPLGPFLWGHRAQARCLRWESRDGVTTVSGEHDGYRRLPGAVVHRRTVTLNGPAAQITIVDELSGGGRHRAALHLHLAEHASIRSVASGVYEVDYGRGSLALRLDPRCSVTVARGSAQPMLGWVSRRYHRKTASSTLTAQCEWEDRLSVVTSMIVGRPQSSRPVVEAWRSGAALALSGAILRS